MAYLPDDDVSVRVTHSHPYRRTYAPNQMADWQINSNFCKEIKEKFPMKQGRHLLDFIDTAILDFLIGNADRHNYQQFWYIFNALNLNLIANSLKNFTKNSRQCIQSFVSHALRSRTKVCTA